MTEDEKDSAVERALFKKALAGDRCAAEFWLTNRKPTYWSRKPTGTDAETIALGENVLVEIRRTAERITEQ